jgi:hypothetical protein
MEFTSAERRYLHREHGELRMPKLLTVEEFVAINCPPEMAERIVARELEKRARRLGPKFAVMRKGLNDKAVVLNDDPLAEKIAASAMF